MKTQTDFRFVADDQGVGWLHIESGKRLPFVAGGAEDDKTKPKGKAKADDGDTTDDDGDTFEIPEDLSEIEEYDEVVALRDRAQAALDLMAEEITAKRKEGGNPTGEEVEAVRDLAEAIKAIKADIGRRDEEIAELNKELDEALASVKDEEPEPEANGDEPDADQVDDGGDGDDSDTVEQPEGELVAASARRTTIQVKAPRTLNPTLGDISRKQGQADVNDSRPPLSITAAADVPHFGNGEEIPDLDKLAQAASDRCKALGNSPHFVPLAQIHREFPMVMDPDNQTPQQQREAWEKMLADQVGSADLSSPKAMEGLVAAGGWCAPSEIRYNFFQISEVAGLVDLPTFGVRRGGLKWPQSLSLADFFALAGAPTSGLPSNSTMPWEWTETDDIAAATGSPTKACLRPPCPSFDEARLRVFGLCVLAGNLTEDAFPELIRHFIAQTVIAHSRVINRRIILQMVALANGTVVPTVTGDSAVNAWLGGLELQAIDYRAKHGMRDGAVLEVVAPSWARGALRSDVAKKNGIDRLDAADAYLMSLFDVRNLRVQWVQDWQTRLAAGIAPVGGGMPQNWPGTADVLMYAPGTFGRGNGMTLDLGVVRDSTLNATNDHTAAWSEEATLVAKFGHEARVVTLPTAPNGNTGLQVASTGV